MRLPFLASFIIFIAWLTYELAKSRKKAEKLEKSFWDREREANNTRKKPLDGLNFISLPLDELPFGTAAGDNERIQEYEDVLRTLSTQKIVNLTGYSNTDLKLMYGAPNITVLTEYDQNYTLLARTLQQWASSLAELGFTAEAKTILEFAVSTDTDVSGSYRLLSSIYHDNGEDEKIASLLQRAQTLRSLSKNSIVRILQEFCPSSD